MRNWPALGVFSGLNVLPKCTSMSTYSYSLDDVHILRLQKAFVSNASRIGLYDGKYVNLDFHNFSFYKQIRRGIRPTLVFDSKFTSYQKLSELNADHRIKFITLRRRGKNLLEEAEGLSPWRRIEIPHVRRKYKNPQVHPVFNACKEAAWF